MFGRFLSRWILVAALLTPAALLHAALPSEPEVAGATSFAGRLLVASPDLRDPFDHAVVVLAQHDRKGALGLVINHPITRRPIATVLGALGLDATGITDSIVIFLGGPVSPNIAFATQAAGVLRDLGHGHGPKRSLIAFGYAGWAPRQLDDEIARGAWVIAPADPGLVFDTDRAKVWSEAMALYKNGH